MKLSMCIVSFNDMEELKDTFNGLAQQRELLSGISGDVELLVSDNASTDDTQEVIKLFQSRSYFPIRNFRQDTNLGFRGNLEFCATEAIGEWILYLGAGSVPNIQAIMDFLSTPWPAYCHLVYFNSRNFDVRTGVLEQSEYSLQDKPSYSQAPFPFFRRRRLLEAMASTRPLSGDYWPQVEWALSMSKDGPSSIEVLPDFVISSKRPESGWWSASNAFLVPLSLNLVLEHALKHDRWDEASLRQGLVTSIHIPAIWIYQSRVVHRSSRPEFNKILRIINLSPNHIRGFISTLIALLVWGSPRILLAFIGQVHRRLFR